MTDVGPTTNNWLGRNGYPDPSFDGLMDDVRLYTSALTAADVAAMYDEGIVPEHDHDRRRVTRSPVAVRRAAEGLDHGHGLRRCQPDPDGRALDRRCPGRGRRSRLTDGAATFPPSPSTPGRTTSRSASSAAGWRDSAASVSHTVPRPPGG